MWEYGFYIGSHGIIESLKTLFNFSIRLIDGYVFYMIIFSIMLICYLLIRPFISWFVTLHSIRLLTYIFSSLFVLILMLIFKVFVKESHNLLVNLFEVTLHCLAIFGLSLVVFHVVQRVVKGSEY